MKLSSSLLLLSSFASLLTVSSSYADTFAVSGASIQQNGVDKTWRGANAMHVFGGNSNDMNAWNMDIVREFIGDAKNTPITGQWAVYANGAWLHPLEKYIANNRANGKVTILTPFGWNGTAFTGKNPSAQPFYNDYKAKMREWANYIKNQPDVWIEVWNEPYNWSNVNYPLDHSLWLADMIDMVDNIRSTGCNNIILVPGHLQGQGEEAILAKGDALLAGRKNIVFDLHAYERWLLNIPLTNIEARLNALKAKKFAVLFGEIGPMNAGTLMNPADFLKAARRQNLTTLAWLWKLDGNDRDALLDKLGNPNNNNNNNWGTLFKNFALSPRSFKASIGGNAGYAGDVDMATAWSTGIAQAAGQSFTMGFGLSKNWNHLHLDMSNFPDNYPRNYTVSVSDDGVIWNPKSTGAGTGYVTDIWLDPQVSRWVRITLKEPPLGTISPWSINEVTAE